MGHKLSYNPEKRSSPCSTVSEKIRNFITEKEIDIVFYKGGTIEKNLCEELLIPSMNIEDFGVTKAACHPRFEVHHYYDQTSSVYRWSVFRSLEVWMVYMKMLSGIDGFQGKIVQLI